MTAARVTMVPPSQHGTLQLAAQDRADVVLSQAAAPGGGVEVMHGVGRGGCGGRGGTGVGGCKSHGLDHTTNLRHEFRPRHHSCSGGLVNWGSGLTGDRTSPTEGCLATADSGGVAPAIQHSRIHPLWTTQTIGIPALMRCGLLPPRGAPGGLHTGRVIPMGTRLPAQNGGERGPLWGGHTTLT